MLVLQNRYIHETKKLKSEYTKHKNYNNYIPPKGKVRLQYASSTEKDERDIFEFYDECQKAKRMKIIGKAGMGKTTAIYELMNYDIENYKKCLPVEQCAVENKI